MSQRAEIIAQFVRGDPFLYSHYLLRVDRISALPVDSFESYLMFVLWFMVQGRNTYTLPLVIKDAVRDVVTALDPHDCHSLMYYVAGGEQLTIQGDALRAWYYGYAVPHLQIAPFLAPEELRILGKAVAGPDTSTVERLFDDHVGEWAGSTDHEAFRDGLMRLVAKAPVDIAVPRVAIVGFHRSVLGLGEDARCLFDCLCEAGIAPELVDVSPTGLEAHGDADRYRPFEVQRPTAPIVIFCMPVFEMMRAIAALGLTRPTQPQYRIGYWPWETTALPQNWRHVYDAVDEVWASSTFLREVYASETRKPVVHMPLHIRVEEPVVPEDLRPLFGRRFTFITIFDFNSRVERKNPLGAIEAFKRAFPSDCDDVQLVLKTLHGQNRQSDLDAIGAAIDDDDRFVIIDGALPKAELCGLIALSDVYLSLHRAEGFGRPIAEAMLLKTPVIATGWSGCADFLNARTGHPVRSVLRDVRKNEYPFAAGQWAEPDVDHAARLMRQVYMQRDTPPSLSAAAERMIRNSLGLTPISERIRNRLSSIAGATGLVAITASSDHSERPAPGVCVD